MGSDEDVLGFEIRMDNVVRVYQVQCFGDLNNKCLKLPYVILHFVH